MIELFLKINIILYSLFINNGVFLRDSNQIGLIIVCKTSKNVPDCPGNNPDYSIYEDIYFLNGVPLNILDYKIYSDNNFAIFYIKSDVNKNNEILLESICTTCNENSVWYLKESQAVCISYNCKLFSKNSPIIFGEESEDHSGVPANLKNRKTFPYFLYSDEFLSRFARYGVSIDEFCGEIPEIFWKKFYESDQLSVEIANWCVEEIPDTLHIIKYRKRDPLWIDFTKSKIKSIPNWVSDKCLISNINLAIKKDNQIIEMCVEQSEGKNIP